MAKSTIRRKRAPKSVLKLPDLEQSKSAVLNSLTSPSSQRTYDHAIRELIEWYCSELRLAFNKTVVTRYRISLEQQHYASTTLNLRLAAVRRLAYEAADCGLLSADLAAGIRRVKGAKRLGTPVGNWLSAEQGRRLLRTVNVGSLRGKRDFATLAILLGCGLRRAELMTLRVEDIQQREEHWVIADLVGKGGHIRTIPIPEWVKAAIDSWMEGSGIADGVLLWSINKAGRVWGDGFSPKVIWGVVKEKAKICEIPALAPHDLQHLCSSVSSGRRGTGANPVPFRTRLCSNDRAIPRMQTALPRCGQRSDRSRAGPAGISLDSTPLADIPGLRLFRNSFLSITKLLDTNSDYVCIAEVMAIGEFEYLLLAVASSLDGEAYGASIRKRLEADGHPRSIGAIHTGLDRLEAKGLIVTHMGEPTSERGGRAKRIVKVTTTGVQAASDFYKMIHTVSRGSRWAEIAR